MLRPAGSAFDDSNEKSQNAALARAAKLARANGQIVAWDRSEREYAIAVWDARTEQVHPLTDEQVAILLNREPLIRRAWWKWNAASRNRGSLIVLDAEMAWRALGPDEISEDEIEGLA